MHNDDDDLRLLLELTSMDSIIEQLQSGVGIFIEHFRVSNSNGNFFIDGIGIVEVEVNEDTLHMYSTKMTALIITMIERHRQPPSHDLLIIARTLVCIYIGVCVCV